MDQAPKSLSENISKLISQLESFSKTLPALPENVREIIVKIAPYLSIFAVVMSLPAILAVFGLGALMTPLAAFGGVGYYSSFSLSIIFLIIVVALQAMAIPGLFSRSKSAWNLMFYSTVVNVVYYVLTMNLGSLVIGTAISLYFLFQVKSYYK